MFKGIIFHFAGDQSYCPQKEPPHHTQDKVWLQQIKFLLFKLAPNPTYASTTIPYPGHFPAPVFVMKPNSMALASSSYGTT